MVEYINLIGGNFNSLLQQAFTPLIDFFQTPEGLIFIAIILAGLFAFKR